MVCMSLTGLWAMNQLDPGSSGTGSHKNWWNCLQLLCSRLVGTLLCLRLRRSEAQHRQVFRTGISLWLLWRAGYNQHKFRRWDGFNLFLMDDADNGCWHVSVSDALEALRIFLRGVRSPCVAWPNHLFTPTDLKDIFPPRIGWKSWGVNFTGKPLQDVDTLQQAAGQPLRGKCSGFFFFLSWGTRMAHWE